MSLRLTDEAGPGPIDLGDLAGSAGLDVVEVLERHRIQGGFALAKWVLALIAIVLVLIAMYAAATYPDPAMTADLQPDPAKRLAAYEGMRDDWFAGIKDLLQLLVVSLLIPLLATLVGYIFGRQSGGAVENG